MSGKAKHAPEIKPGGHDADDREHAAIHPERRADDVGSGAKLTPPESVAQNRHTRPVVVTEHAAKAFGPTIEPLRSALASYAPLHKMVFSCFGSEEFRAKLESLGRKQVVVAGYETHVCVCQTALDAQAAGYQVHLVRDASSSRTAADGAVGVEKMSGAGILPASTETVIFELLEKAGTDEFRALLPVIKRK